MRECVKISINGVPLNQPDKWALTVQTTPKWFPRFKQATAEVPGMDGVIAPKLLELEPGVLTVGVKIRGATAADNRQHVDELVRTLFGRGQLVRIDLEGADGIVRTNHGRASESSLNELVATMADGRVEFFLPNPVWRSAASWVPVSRGMVVELEELRGSSGPVSYVAALSGPGTELRVTDIESGEHAHWVGERDPLKTLLVDRWRAGEHSVRPDTPNVAGNAARSAEIESVGRIWPSVDGRYRVRVDVVGAGQDTAVSLYVGRAWL